MKKKLSNIVALIIAMVFLMTSMAIAIPIKAVADTRAKVTGLCWESDNYIGHWNAYDFSPYAEELNYDPAYYVILYKDGNLILDSSSAEQPGFIDDALTYCDFTSIITAKGPGNYSFEVAAYINDPDDLYTTRSEKSAVKTVDPEKYHLNISMSSPYENESPGRVYLNNTEIGEIGQPEAAEYQWIELKAEPFFGYRFMNWTTTTDGVEVSSGSFSMPGKAVDVCAVFETYLYSPNPRWYGETFVANWNKYEGCRGYWLNLYKDNGGTPQKIGDRISIEDADTVSYDFTSVVEENGQGTYYFDMQAYFVNGSTSGTETSESNVNNNSSEINSIGFSLNTGSITKLKEGLSAAEAKSEIIALCGSGSLLSGLRSSVKLESSNPVRLTSTTLVSSELGDATIIEKEKTYFLCFHFVPNDSGDVFASTVSGPFGAATLIREDDHNCYVYCPIESGSSGGSTPDPDPNPGPNPNGNGLTPLEQAGANIDSAQPGDTITYDFGDWHSLPLWFMTKVASRPDLTYVFKCVYENEDYVFTINPGDQFELDCDWYGPLKMATLFDTEITDANGIVRIIKNRNKVYIIQEGDTLSKIAAKFKTTVAGLLKLNASIKNRNVIIAGKKLYY